MTSLWRWLKRAVFAAVVAVITLIVGGAYDARRRHPDLKPWHRVSLDDLRASTLDDRFTFAQYQAREEQLFAQVHALESTLDPADRTPVNRYNPGSLSHPSSAGRDWNRSFETTPAVIRGGALLIHGLTDSPYSMRTVAEVLRGSGIYSLALRMPGHGTLPSGLVSATSQDWIAPRCGWACATCRARFPRERRSFSSATRTAAHKCSSTRSTSSTGRAARGRRS